VGSSSYCSGCGRSRLHVIGGNSAAVEIKGEIDPQRSSKGRDRFQLVVGGFVGNNNPTGSSELSPAIFERTSPVHPLTDW
jgi:hypothetical protein